MEQHPLATLDEQQLRDLLSYYREQEKAGNLNINSSEFHDGELLVVNYTDKYNEGTAPEDWDWRMELARGSVFFKKSGSAPQVVVQAMPKFHGYTHCPEAQRHIAEDRALKIMQKFDGSCISIAFFQDEVLLFTRGARHNLQTRLARALLTEASMKAIEQMEGQTFAVELIHIDDGKVEQNRGSNRLVLLYACEATGRIVPVEELASIADAIGLDCVMSEDVTGNMLMERLKALDSVTSLEDMREGFVVEMLGKKYKVYNEVEKMQAGPLNYGTLAKSVLEQHLAHTDSSLAELRSLHSSFPGPKELSQSNTVSKADKTMLFPCLRLAAHERDAWFDRAETKFAMAQNLARQLPSTAEPRGFPVSQGRLVLCGAPGKKAVESWAEGLDCVATLLTKDELKGRGLDLAASVGLSKEWLHLPISGAALEDSGDRTAVKAAATAVVEHLKSGKTVAVHCSAGLHRTGAVGYLTLRLLGWSKGGAFELLGQIRWETRAELEKIYYKGLASAPDPPANLVSVAEELLVEMSRVPATSEGYPSTDL